MKRRQLSKSSLAFVTIPLNHSSRKAPLGACFALVLAAVITVCSAHADPTVQNGSFESPAIGPNNVVAGAGDFWSSSTFGCFTDSNNFASFGTTPYGNQYLVLNADANGYVTQGAAGFLAGQTYVLSLFFADYAGRGSNPTLTVEVGGVATGGGTFFAPVSGPNGNNPYPFQLAEVSFTPYADGAVEFALIATNGWLAIDNVTLAVPEPSTWAAGLLTAGALLCSIWRRRAGWLSRRANGC